VAYGYTDGLQTSITAELPSPETDQVTTCFYGTQKGTPSASKLATGHLLRAVKYPDSTNSGTTTAYIDGTSDADVVSHSYNAQGQETRKKEQAGNVLESDYDLSGRLIARKATTIDADFDDEVQLIQTTYDSLGRRETVTQRASTSVDGSGIANGTIIDQVKYLYDGWGNVTNFRQDLDSAVGGSGYREVAYTYAKATNGRNTIRRAEMTLPDGTAYDYLYRGGNWHDEEASRVTTIKDAYDVDIVNYDYNGVGQVVRTQYDEVDVFSKTYNGTGTTFAALDRFDRTVISRWTKALTPNITFYRVDVGYDENSNITYQDDVVHSGHDVLYTNDDLNRLIGAEEGTLTGGPPPTSITSRTRNQVWGLNQTGNWNTNLVDLDGDNDGADADELNETRTHNAVNELGARDIDSDTSDDYSLAYDEVGNMIDDGEDCEYVWDVFGRLRAVYVRNTSPAKSDLVSEYRYNGLGYLVSRHQDTNTDGDVDGSDVTFETVFDERWRAVAIYRSGDSDPKELFLQHAAGASGFGGSSYIDHVVLRDRDATNGWAGATDGTLEERVYYCQNWRADVVALIDGAGGLLEWVKYSAYGVPFGLPAKDADSDGDYDSVDDTVISGWGAYDVRGDVNLDGVIDGGDTATSQALGRGALSSNGVGNRKGYAGYEADAKLAGAKWHVRHRVLCSTNGYWLSMDPLEYVDGPNRLQYCGSLPLAATDSSGLMRAERATTKEVKCTSGFDLSLYGIGITNQNAACGINCNWNMPLEKKYKEGPAPNFLIGVIVQKVKIWASWCPCPETTQTFQCQQDSVEFFEGWMMDSMHIPSDTLGAGFQWGIASMVKTAEAKFYSRRSPLYGEAREFILHGNTGPGAPGPFMSSSTTGGSTWTTHPLDWWSSQGEDESAPLRTARSDGECCPIGPPICHNSCTP
jgi:RHS repeat-associated protein